MPGDPQTKALDQREWQDLTTWPGAPPRDDVAWSLLSDDELPARYRTKVEASSHPFIRRLRRGAVSTPRKPAAEASLVLRKRWNNRFANLVSGRFTEVLFFRAYATAITKLGLEIVATVERRDWQDYLVESTSEGFRLAVNIKNAGVQFRQAQSFVGMAPEDTLPIATYKIFGSSAREEQLPLVYVYLVDWTLLARLRAAYWDALNEAERRVFQLAATVQGMPRDLEDSFIEATVADRVDALSQRVGYDPTALDQLPFRAISGARCKAIFYRDHQRSPYVFLQRMDTDPNVHVSVARETVHFSKFIADWLGSPQQRTDLMAGLRRTTTMAVPDPPV